MDTLRGSGVRPPNAQSLVNVLESDGPLPDDDPATRNGGLDPSRQKDIGQIQMYAQLRQQGNISDKAWRKLIQRNPRSATLFSSIAPSVESSLARGRSEIGKEYFSPGEMGNIITGGEDDQMVRYGQTKPPKADTKGAILAALQRGDVEFARSLGYGSGSGENTEKQNKLAFDQEEKLRGEFRGLSKDFIQVRDSYGRIQESAKNPSAAGDLALIFNYMKMLDPGSTVREGEFATAQNSAGWDERARAMYNKAISGERLGDGTRSDFLKRAEALYKRQSTTQKKNEIQYRRLAKRYGVDSDRVITDFNLESMPEEPKDTSQIQSQKVINGKTYVKINGQWFEQ